LLDEGLIRDSKFLSYLLRHNPGKAGIDVDRQGWADLGQLERNTRGRLSASTVADIIEQDPRGRFELSDDRSRVRACYGHSIEVEPAGDPVADPPDLLYHGTARRNLDQILREGLRPGSRQYVHLSPTAREAAEVGSRHGVPVVLEVDATAAHAAGIEFHRAPNGLYLVREVPPEFLGVRKEPA
jgi:putative RNA 2'-phosphotransferase